MDPKKFSNDGFILMSSLFTEPFFSCLRAEKWKEQFYIAEWNFFTPSTLITLLLSELDKKNRKIFCGLMKNSLHLSFQAQTNLLISNIRLSLKKVPWNLKNGKTTEIGSFFYFYHDVTEGLRTQNHFVKWLLLNYVTS